MNEMEAKRCRKCGGISFTGCFCLKCDGAFLCWLWRRLKSYCLRHDLFEAFGFEAFDEEGRNE